MLRLRRYRVFLAFAVISLIALYHFRNVRQWDDGVESLLRHSPIIDTKFPPKPNGAGANAQDKKADNDQVVASTSALSPATTTPTNTRSLLQVQSSTSETFSSSSLVLSEVPEATKKISSHEDRPPAAVEPTDIALIPIVPGAKDKFEGVGRGRLEKVKETGETVVYWSQAPEHFPIPSQSIIPIPTGKPKAIPRIQYAFPDESSSARITREKKQATIKDTFVRSWGGYKKYAWMQDELSPISGQFRNPFCGWAATLVDSLDSLWIMDMKEEFEEAAGAVKDIEFTTSLRGDVPIFETTIRYLGGLLGAYDISGSKYKVFLDKAVELAEILMGAFDTPNRMPITYYYWKPTFASQPHRASTRAVLAELGSLSVEFTRLAQITKESKYYDAIARITNEFEIWQKSTRLPGLWPKIVDASGCKKPEQMLTTPSEQIMQHNSAANLDQGRQVAATGDKLANGQPGSAAQQAARIEELLLPISGGSALGKGNTKITSNIAHADEATTNPLIGSDTTAEVYRKEVIKRQLTPDDTILVSHPATGTMIKPKFDCEPQGLTSPPNTKTGLEHFTVGGTADSVYEYLPKQYMLLGGVVEQYQVMYELAIEATSKHLLYRPMVPGDRNILHLGSASLNAAASLDTPGDLKLTTEGSHLGCFAGGMYAVGAKIFGRKDDIDIAAKLTDGCVWAYEATQTGIMPEEFMLVACEDRESCSWNQTKYHEALDPYRADREANSQKYSQSDSGGNRRMSSGKAGSKVEQSEQAKSPTAAQVFIPPADGKVKNNVEQSEQAKSPLSANFYDIPDHKRTKRQLEDITPGSPAVKPMDKLAEKLPSNGALLKADSLGREDKKGGIKTQEADPVDNVPTNTYVPPASESPTTPTHQEFVAARIKNERLPPGFTGIRDRRYILRPEAIESVFIMYRITGDESWRDKGWNMFTAIQNYTTADYGNSAISDVTVDSPYGLDEMESFWLAETLKYFYLLFSDPGLVSLDDWILNTEAHPFKRIK